MNGSSDQTLFLISNKYADPEQPGKQRQIASIRIRIGLASNKLTSRYPIALLASFTTVSADSPSNSVGKHGQEQSI